MLAAVSASLPLWGRGTTKWWRGPAATAYSRKLLPIRSFTSPARPLSTALAK
jgi:hypothetical protein